MKRLSIIMLSLVVKFTVMAAGMVDTLSIESGNIVSPAKFVVALPEGYDSGV